MSRIGRLFLFHPRALSETAHQKTQRHVDELFWLKPCWLFKSSLLVRVDRIVIGACFFCIQVLRNGVQVFDEWFLMKMVLDESGS